MAIPNYLKMTLHLSEMRSAKSRDIIIKQACSAALLKLEHTILKQPHRHACHSTVATVCDPRLTTHVFAKLWPHGSVTRRIQHARKKFWEVFNRCYMKEHLLQVEREEEQEAAGSASTATDARDSDDELFFHGDRVSESEMDRNPKEPGDGKNTQPLAWRKTKHYDSSTVSMIARNHPVIPATSAR